MKALRQAKVQCFVNILNEAKGNSKRVWQTINKLIKKDIKSCNKCLELDFKGSTIDKPDEIADVFNNYFVDSVKNLSDEFVIRHKEIKVSEFRKICTSFDNSYREYNSEYYKRLKKIPMPKI